MTEPSRHVAGLLLTGGASRRMGRDKARLVLDGTTLAQRTAALLVRTVSNAIEVGPATSGLSSTCEDQPGEGPLAAIAAGWAALRASGHDGDVLVLSCDLPLLSERLLRFLVDYDAPGTVLPLVDGRVQPLCARWSRHDLNHASELVAKGVRSLRHLESEPDTTLLDGSHWQHVANRDTFFDVDSPADLEYLGLQI